MTTLHLENAGFRPPHRSSRPKGALHPPSGIEAIAVPLWLAPIDGKGGKFFHRYLGAPKAPKAQQIYRKFKISNPPKKTEALLAHQLELTFPIDAQKFVAPANATQTFFAKHQIFPPFVALFPHTGWAPTVYNWGSNPTYRLIGVVDGFSAVYNW